MQAKPILLALAVVAAGTTAVQAKPKGGDPRQMFEQIRAELGVSQDEMRNCMEPMRKARGSKPDAAARDALKAEVNSCLKTANPDLTDDAIEAAFDKMPRRSPQRG